MSDDLTPEAVERLCQMLLAVDKSRHGYTGHPRYNRDGMQAEQVIRALSARLADVEAERDVLKAAFDLVVNEPNKAKVKRLTAERDAAEAALAAARADALREAAEAIKTDYRISSVIIDGVEVFGCEAATPASCYEAILALIPKELTNDR